VQAAVLGVLEEARFVTLGDGYRRIGDVLRAKGIDLEERS
jgi:hypothetical protein